MQTYQQYIEAFTAFAEDAFASHQPKRDPNTSQGSIAGMSSYIKDYEKQLISLNGLLVEKANELLTAADQDGSLDKAKLKNELQTLGVTLIKGYMLKNKPQ